MSGAAEGTDSTAVTADSPAPSLASLYSANTSVATTSFRPPKPPGHKFVCVFNSLKRQIRTRFPSRLTQGVRSWKPSAEQAPSDPNAYFPMILYDTARA